MRGQAVVAQAGGLATTGSCRSYLRSYQCGYPQAYRHIVGFVVRRPNIGATGFLAGLLATFPPSHANGRCG